MAVYDESGHRIEEYDLDKGYLENKSEAVEHRWVVDSEEQGECDNELLSEYRT